MRLDISGMILMGLGLFGGMLAASWLVQSKAGVLSPVFLLSVLTAVTTLFLFFRHIGRVQNPFIEPAMIHGHDFGPVNLVNVIYGGAVFGSMSLVPLYATNRYGLGPFDAGTLLIAQGIATVVFSIAAAFALRRTGHRLPIRVGGVIMALGLVLLALSPKAGLTPYSWLAFSALLVGMGVGIINPACRNAGLQLAPKQSSTLAAIRSMFLQIGAIIAISLSTAVLAASSQPGQVHAIILALVAALLLISMPIINRVPEHHGAW